MKRVDVKLDSIVSEESTIEEVKALVDSKLSAGNKGKWSADIVRDVYGKLVAVNVNLPDSVTENEKANAVNAINTNNGVANSIIYPHTYIDEDMESLAIGTIILPGFTLYESEGASPEGVTTAIAKSGTKSYSCGFGDTKIGRFAQKYDYKFTPNDLQVEFWIKVEGNRVSKFWIGLDGYSCSFWCGKDPGSAYRFSLYRRTPTGQVIWQVVSIPDLTKWYKVIMKSIGETITRIEVQDELGNLVTYNEGNTMRYAGVEMIWFGCQQEIGSGTVNIDDLKIIKLDR